MGIVLFYDSVLKRETQEWAVLAVLAFLLPIFMGLCSERKLYTTNLDWEGFEMPIFFTFLGILEKVIVTFIYQWFECIKTNEKGIKCHGVFASAAAFIL